MKVFICHFSILICLALFSSELCPAQIQSGKEYDVYFLAGQSNATGRGDAEELPSIDDGRYFSPQADVLFYYRCTLKNRAGEINTRIPEKKFQALQAGSGHGFNSPSSHSNEFGPELALGRTLADAFPQRNVLVVKYSHGGSNLHSDWAAGGPKYTVFLEVVKEALGEIKTAGATVNLKGLVWVQGEADISKVNSNAYEANLTDFIKRVRADVFAGEMASVVISRLSDNQYKSLGDGVVKVRQAQVAVAEADPNVGWVDTDGDEFSTYDIANPIHFDAKGNIAQGTAMAKKLISLSGTE